MIASDGVNQDSVVGLGVHQFEREVDDKASAGATCNGFSMSRERGGQLRSHHLNFRSKPSAKAPACAFVIGGLRQQRRFVERFQQQIHEAGAPSRGKTASLFGKFGKFGKFGNQIELPGE